MSSSKSKNPKQGKGTPGEPAPKSSFIDNPIMKQHKEKLESAGIHVFNEPKVENAAYAIVQGFDHHNRPGTLKVEFDFDPETGRLRCFLSEPKKSMQPMDPHEAIHEFLTKKDITFLSTINNDSNPD